jgi:hydroxypyruvate isomerase
MQVPSIITFFGNRRGMSDEEATANCVAGLNRVKKLGEDHGVTICVELLNSKVNHPDYQGDRTAFGVAIVKAVDSPRVKLLYDIYPMQIMEGDPVHDPRHKHRRSPLPLAVPGRTTDETQEINQPRGLPRDRPQRLLRIPGARVRADSRSTTSLREVTLCDAGLDYWWTERN